MRQDEDLVKLLVQLRVWLVDGSDDHRGVLRIMCDGMKRARNLGGRNRVQTYEKNRKGQYADRNFYRGEATNRK